MNVRSREQALEAMLAIKQEALPDCLDRIYYRRKKSSLHHVVSHIARYELGKALHGYYVDGEADSLKQSLYRHCRLQLSISQQGDGSTYDTLVPFLCAVLSDDEPTIQEMAMVQTKHLQEAKYKPDYPQFAIGLAQAAMRNDDAEVGSLLALIAKDGSKKQREELGQGRNFYALLLQRDEEGLRNLIQSHHSKIRAKDAWFEDWLSVIATFETKLAWRRGIQIQIDSPWVPMNLMPIEPLEKYEDVYEFLNPNWVPPRQGLLGQIERLFTGKKRFTVS